MFEIILSTLYNLTKPNEGTLTQMRKDKNSKRESRDLT